MNLTNPQVALLAAAIASNARQDGNITYPGMVQHDAVIDRAERYLTWIDGK